VHSHKIIGMRKGMTAMGLLALAAALALPSAEVQATTTTSKSARAKTRKPPVDKGPAESRVERDKRLQRECKGKPNAGACEGYGG
jgi:hypothetical protein